MLRAILAGAAGIGWAWLSVVVLERLPIGPSGEVDTFIAILYALGTLGGLGGICIWIITTPVLDRILGDAE